MAMTDGRGSPGDAFTKYLRREINTAEQKVRVSQKEGERELRDYHFTVEVTLRACLDEYLDFKGWKKPNE